MNDTIQDGVMIISPTSERMDGANAGALKSRFVDALNEGQRAFVIDLGAVDFMDSTGLGALMSCLKSLGGEGNIVIASPSQKVRKLFALTRLDKGVFDIFVDVDEAVTHLVRKGV